MEKDKSSTIHISDRHHLNITINLFYCGEAEISYGTEERKNIDYYILYYVNGGTGSVAINNTRTKLSEGQGFVVFPNTNFAFRSEMNTTLKLSYIAFSGYLVENYLNRSGIFYNKPVFTDGEDLFIKNQIHKIYEVSLKPINRYCTMVSIMYSIFAYLLENSHCKSSAHSSYNREYYTTKAIDFIETNYHNKISIEQIADYLGITRKYFYYVFKSILNLSPKEYIIYYRIEKACKLLANTNQSIVEIADAVGYSNQFYFSKEFKRTVGTTPTQYRDNPVKMSIFDFKELKDNAGS